jgi:hypothetical protein
MNITVFGASGARPATWWPSPSMAGTRSAPSYRTTPQDPPGCELAAEFLSDLCRLDDQLRDTRKKLTAAVLHWAPRRCLGTAGTNQA